MVWRQKTENEAAAVHWYRNDDSGCIDTNGLIVVKGYISTMTNIIIRKMRQEDISEVQQIAKITWNHTYEGIISEDVQEEYLQHTYSDESLKEWVEKSITFVAETDGKIIGYANFLPLDHQTKSSTLSAIYINPNYQGKGIETKLLHAGIGELKGVTKIYIGLEKGNATAQTFYESKGFEFVKEFKEKCYGLEFTTVQMVLHVPK